MLTGCLLALFRNNDVTGYTILIAPIALQEMVFAVWLLIKGFTPSPLTPRASSGGDHLKSDVRRTPTPVLAKESK